VRRTSILFGALLLLIADAAPAAARTDGSTPAPAQVSKLVTHVPASTLNQVGVGKLWGPSEFSVTKLSGSPFTSGGKPDLLNFELAWCPHCEANSWALAITLSRFGTLSHLGVIDSGTLYGTKFHAKPSYPHTKGLSFFHAVYKSSYLSFSNVILENVKGQNLQKPTKREEAALDTFDPPASQGFPAVDAGGAYGFINSGYSPGVLAGKSWKQIAGVLASPTNRIAQSIDGLANLFTAAMCVSDGGKPATVCNSAGVVAAGKARLSAYPIAP